MKKQVVFMHQNYPAQFGPVSVFLLQNYDVDVHFFSETRDKPIVPGTKYYKYEPAKTGHEENPYFFSRHFERETSSMHGLLGAIQKAKVNPDVLIGHVAFGNMGLLHLDYQHIPRIGFFELFYNPFEKDIRQEYQAPKPNRIRIPIRNATQLVELNYCTKGYSPTEFQRSTYPDEYKHKLSVLFDGIDTNYFCPGEPQGALKRTWPQGVKLVTYVSRGLEAMRGFDIFMEVAHNICQVRDDVHFVVAGSTKTHYGSEMITIKEPTFKDFVLKQRDYDLSRFHFLDWISEAALLDLFRLSDCHFYWTVPFTLSWSLFQSMASGCLVMGSNTPPVRDAVFPGETGLMADPLDRQAFTDQILDALENPAKHKALRENARNLMTEKFNFEICLPKLAEFFLAD